MSQGLGIYARSPLDGVLLQGEILSDLLQSIVSLESLEAGGEAVLVDFKKHPLAIVMSNDCDLDLDYKARAGSIQPDKKIPNILFCEMKPADELLQMIRSSPGPAADIWDRIGQNNDPRYQFLEKVKPDVDALGYGLGPLCIDFKRYFSIPTEEAYLRLRQDVRRRCYLLSPYVEHLTTRFYSYQARVALDEEHKRK